MRRGIPFLAAAVAAVAGTAGPARAQGPPMPVAPDTLPDYVADALSLYRTPPGTGQVREILARWRADSEGPRSPRDSLAVARLWGRAFAPDEAIGWLPEPDAAAAGPERAALAPRLRLERARLLLAHEAGRRPGGSGPPPDSLPGAADFAAACEAAGGEVAHEIWIDLRAMFTPDERERWHAAPDAAGRCAIVRGAFEERALRSATTPDERLALHYRRLAGARARYSVPRVRFMRTASGWRGRPDSLEVDDRGLIWIRLGAPDHVEYASGAVGDGQLGTEPEIALGVQETWVFELPAGTWLFHFVPCDMNLREPCMPRSGHALVESFGPLAVPGTGFFQRYVTRLALDPLPLKRKAFALFPADGLDAALDAAEDRMRGRQEQLLARELQTRAITEIPDAPGLLPGIDVAFEPLRFWTPSIGEATVWFVATARAGQLVATPEASGIERRRLELRLALGGPGGTEVRAVERRVETRGPLGSEDGLDVWLRATLAPGPLPYTLALRDRSADGSVGNWIQDTLNVPDFGGVRGSLLPALSDVAFAPDSGGAWTRDGRVFLPVTAAHATGPNGRAHIYFETYGIRPGATYGVELRLVPERDADRIWRLDAEDVAYRVSFDAEMPAGGSGIGRHHLRLELGDTPPGPYVLGLRATKSGTGERSLPVTTPIFVTGQDRSDAKRQGATRR